MKLMVTQTSIDQHGMSATENTTVTSVKSNAMTAVGILAVGILVAAGFAVIKMFSG
jgi:hypothetical protein